MHTRLLRGLALGLLIAVLAACSSVDAPAADAELETLQNPEFIGREENLDDLPLQPSPQNGVCFYRDRNLDNERLCFTTDDPVPLGFRFGFTKIRPSWNDDVSSLIVAPGYDVIMYTDANYGGRATVAGSDNEPRYVYRVNNDNALSSFKIIRTN